MQVSQEKLNEWNSLREQGDLKELTNKSNRCYKSVFNALKTGRASVKLIAKIDRFYQKRALELKRINETDNN